MNTGLGEPQRMSARSEEEKHLLWISAPNRQDSGQTYKVYKFNA
jgi:hypothetical protein